MSFYNIFFIVFFVVMAFIGVKRGLLSQLIALLLLLMAFVVSYVLDPKLTNMLRGITDVQIPFYYLLVLVLCIPLHFVVGFLSNIFISITPPKVQSKIAGCILGLYVGLLIVGAGTLTVRGQSLIKVDDPTKSSFVAEVAVENIRLLNKLIINIGDNEEVRKMIENNSGDIR